MPLAVGLSAHKCFLEELKEAHPPLLYVTLRQDNNSMPCAISQKGIFPEGCLYQVHDPLPFACLWVPLPCCHCNKPLEFIQPHLWQPTWPVEVETLDWPINLSPLIDIFVYDECIFNYWDNLPQLWNACVHCDPICRHICDGDATRGRWTVGDDLIPSPHMKPQLFYKG